MSDKAKHWKRDGFFIIEGRKVVADCRIREGKYDEFGLEAVTDFEEVEANVRLIAEAPEFLEALLALGSMPEGYCFCFGHGRDPSKAEGEHTGECQQARAAIAKVEGK